MALSLSSTRVSLRPCNSQRRSVKPLPPPRAGLGEAMKSVGDAFVKIFSKPESTMEDWKNTGNTGFSGKISHHGPGKPFKDGFVNKAGVAAAAAQEQQEQGEKGSSYLGEAVQNVVGHNFTGDETEPPVNTGAAGWKGDIHDRKKDGFHNRKV